MPTYLYEARASRPSRDIAKFKDELGGKIYGIEPGNDGNRLILDMIEDDKFGLQGFEIVESSEQGMLAQVERAAKRKEPIVFLGWEPHPMNAKFEMNYLAGGDDVFGPNLGGATIYTNVRAGYAHRMPERRQRFVKNLKFSLPMENEVMGYILFDSMEAGEGRRGVAEGQPEGLGALARRRHHLRRQAGPRRGQEEPRALSRGCRSARAARGASPARRGAASSTESAGWMTGSRSTRSRSAPG